MTKFNLAVGSALIAGGLAVAAYALPIVARPPMPVPLGAAIWDYETGFSVTHVVRRPLRAGITAYEVTVRVFCPFGERYRWTPRSAHVIDNAGVAYASAAATPEHRVLGASDTEHMTFDLPSAIEQPALVFDDTLGPAAFFDELRAGRVYEPARFNLRYD